MAGQESNMKSADQVFENARKYGSAADVLIRQMSGISELESSASGAWITGHKGGRFLDFGSFALFLFGHGNQLFCKELTSQLKQLAGSSRSMLNTVHGEALEALSSLTSEPLNKVMLLNTGAEAVEVALKLASVRTRRKSFFHLQHSFHGKTSGALSVTDSPIFRSGFPVPVVSQALQPEDTDKAVDLITHHKPAGVICEAIQGEGGVREVADDFLSRIRQACSEVGSVLIMDEIQSGLGRTGQVWAYEKSGVLPDMVLSGKALGGGMIPVSAVIATQDAFRPLDKNPLLHSSTYGGNPLASRAVLCAVRSVREGKIAEKAKHAGDLLKPALVALSNSYSGLFTKVSGRGLMLGLHCQNRHIAGLYLNACYSENLLVTPCLTVPEVIRLSPPACLSEAEAGEALVKLQSAAKFVSTKVA